MRRRTKWLWGASIIIAMSAVGIHLAQSAIDTQALTALTPLADQVQHEWGKLEARQLASAGKAERGFAIERLHATTALVRKDCHGRWTMGIGARLEISGVSAPLRLGGTEGAINLGAKRVCLDVTLDDAWSQPVVTVQQEAPVQLTGPCGPSVSEGRVVWTPGSELGGTLTLTDAAGCLKSFSFLAPQYPNELIPKHVTFDFETRFVDFKEPELKGHSAVSAAAELARRLRGADASFNLGFTTDKGEKISACARIRSQKVGAEFEVGLGASESALKEITRPFVSPENRETLADLRTDEARCDGSGTGLLFTDDLSVVRLRGSALKRRTTSSPDHSGLQAEPCEEGDEVLCGYEWVVIDFDEQKKPSSVPARRAIAQRLRASERGILLVNFVHGWRHSGSPKDSNLFEFRVLLHQLARMESRRQAPREVIGVFMAWPGRLYDSPAANQLATFWDRLKVARELGSESGALGPALDELAEALPLEQHPSSRMITLAHSMGADAVLSVIIAHQERRLGDRLVLINPASSVARYRKIADAQETKLAIYGSVNDQVNQQLYPLGAAVTFNGTTRQELSDQTTTITNASSLITHRLGLRNGAPALCAHELSKPLSEVCGGLSLSVGRLPRRTVTAVTADLLPGHAEFSSPGFADHLLELIASE